LKQKLLKILDEKLKNKSQSLQLNLDIIKEYEEIKNNFIGLYNNLNDIIDKNNNYTNNISNKQNEAKEQLRLNEVKKFLKDIDYFTQIQNIETLKQKKNFWEKRLNRIKTYKNNLLSEIKKLEDKLSDEKASIKIINQFFKLTSSHLKLDIKNNIDKQIFYEVLRENKKAQKLSNGEQSLIAFCYFLAKVKNKLDNETNVIIYIDDPISSLDNNHIFSVFALLEKYITKEKKYFQCFISTHNLDFLRYLKRITVPQDNIEYFLIERIKRQNISQSQITLLPKYLKDYTTELHFTFNKIHKLYNKYKNRNIETLKGEIDNTFNDFYEIPNIIRKFLEYYLFYKYPDNDGLTIKKLSFFGNNAEAEKINRVINEFSHLTYIERAWKPLDVEEILEIINIIIETIQNKDKDYFDSLLKSIK